MSGQTLNDRLTAARHALAGQGLARIVCKATTEEVIGPKKKHLDYLLHCTNEPNVSIPQLANLLIERTQNASWVVVFKALITVHHLMCYGNERFTQYLASSNCTFQLGCFLDKVGVQSYDMSTFIRRYAKYLNEKAVSYRTVAFDFCKCKRGKEDGILRQMNTEQLLKTLPALQAQLDSLLEFDCSTNDLCNGVVNSCFMLLFRDLVRLFACYNDGIINLLGKYFDMNKKHARDALDIYKKFLIRMDRVAEFLKVAENIGIEKSDIPDLTKAPSSLLEALEQHLATLEGRKGSASAASAAARATNVQNAVIALSNTSLAFCSAGESSPENGPHVEESVRKAVEEEAEVMNQLKFDNDSPLLWEQPTWEDTERRLKEMSGGAGDMPPSTKTNPFLSSPCEPPSANQRIIDLFNAPPDGATTNGSATPSDDLLGLGGGGGGGGSGNPFADSLFGTATGKQSTPQQENNVFSATFTNGFGSSSDAFASDASFAAAFGDSPTAANRESPAAETPTLPSPAASTPTSKLSLPVVEEPAFGGGRSASPSPTAEQLMRGAGTTPILSRPFHEEAPPKEDFTWGGTPTHSDAPDIFGDAFQPPPSTNASQAMPPTLAPPPSATHALPPAVPPPPQAPQPSSQTPPLLTSQAPPTAVVTPLSVQSQPPPPAQEIDLFGFDSEVADFGDQPLSAQPCAAPPPSPFGGLDFGGGGPDLRAQAIANAVGVAMPMQQQKPSSGLDDLDFMSQMSQPALSPVVPQGFMGQPMYGGVPMGGATPPASSTPVGFGTPTSGMSSPARSGAAPTMPGGFDAFGDTLQPHGPPAVPKGPQQQSSNSSFLKGDLDSTLASLASNLDINGPPKAANIKKASGHQWGSPKPGVKAGGWTAPASVVPVAGGAVPPAGQPPMGWSPQHAYNQMGGVPPAATGQWGGVMGGGYPQQAPPPGVFQQQPYMGGNVRPPGAMGAPPLQQPPLMGGFPPLGGGMPPTSVNDPFGAL